MTVATILPHVRPVLRLRPDRLPRSPASPANCAPPKGCAGPWRWPRPNATSIRWPPLPATWDHTAEWQHLQAQWGFDPADDLPF